MVPPISHLRAADGWAETQDGLRFTDDGCNLTATIEAYGRTMALPVLRQGSSGDAVRQLQEFLGRVFSGGMTIPPSVTGEFDADTDAAVRAFQAQYGLEADGVVGGDTWAVINDVDPANWTVSADEDQIEGPVDDHEIDMEPMDLRPFGDESDRLPTDADAARGRDTLKSALFEAANNDSWWYADLYEIWDSDWDPHEAGSDMVENAVGAMTSEGPLGLVTGGAQAAMGFIEGLFMDGMYAEYQGRAEAHRWWFFKWVAEGATAGLMPSGFIVESNPIQASAAAGAWQAISELGADQRFDITAAAVQVGADGLPSTDDEWRRAIDINNTSVVESGLFDILWSWGASAPRTRSKPVIDPSKLPDGPTDVFDVGDTTLKMQDEIDRSAP